MNKESLLALQELDCNCNNCIFMQRDLYKYNVSKEFHAKLQLDEFNREKYKLEQNIQFLTERINKLKNDKNFTSVKDMEFSLKDLKRQFDKMQYQFDSSKVMINYGYCEKHKKDVSFIPNICQIETQECFKHRKSNN